MALGHHDIFVYVKRGLRVSTEDSSQSLFLRGSLYLNCFVIKVDLVCQEDAKNKMCICIAFNLLHVKNLVKVKTHNVLFFFCEQSTAGLKMLTQL